MPAKIWRLAQADPHTVSILQNQLGIHPVFCQLLAQRGITSFDEARRFFRPDWAQLHDPFDMAGMDAAVPRLQRALAEGEGILLYGDYDVDGTMGVSLLYDFLAKRGAKLDYYLPDRYSEGYGLSIEGVEYAHRKGLSLIVAIDCGIRDLAAARHAQRLGLDLIICDHHLPGSELPEAAAILDPKRADCSYPYPELSGAGVAFKLAQALARATPAADERQELEPLLDLLVISIAADIVPLTGENRVLAYLGLERLNATERPGIKALAAQSRRQWPLRISDIVFGLAPRINAAGRLADAAQVVKLMLAADREVAYHYAQVLDQRNQLRREFDRRTFEEAQALWLADPDHPRRAAIVLYQPHWHKGVVCIVASRMAEAFHKPAIILTQSDNRIVGSGRSAGTFDLHAALSLCEDVLINYGGHTHAAGLTLSNHWLPAFSDRFEGAAQALGRPEDKAPALDINAELPLSQITPAFYRILRQFGPFGPGNPTPVFLARGVADTGGARRLQGDHLRIVVKQGDSDTFGGIAFNRGHELEQLLRSPAFDLCFSLEENHWKDQVSLQLMVKDVHFD